MLYSPGFRQGRKRRWLRAIFLLLFFSHGTQIFAGGEGITTTIPGTIMQGQTSSGGAATIIPFQVNAVSIVQFSRDNALVNKIQNVITLSVWEETGVYIPENFCVDVDLSIEYKTNGGQVSTTTKTLTVNYNKDASASYNQANYFTFSGQDYVKVTITNIHPCSSYTFDVKKVLQLQNEIRLTRYYNFVTTSKPQFTNQQTNGANPDELAVNWTWPGFAGNNNVQLEWTWIENDGSQYYANTDERFSGNATRLYLPYNVNTYNIPLLYDGPGKLYYRIRGVSIKDNGSCIDGVWSDVQQFQFDGHNSGLNWQATTSFAEDGKRKSVMQYYDGSLRSRQTVTKDNSTNKTITAETFYDGQGRPALQVLPAPGISEVIAYTKNLNLFNEQSANEDPANYFDLKPINEPDDNERKLQTSGGASRYYSSANEAINTGNNKFIPNADGYPYSLTRYTPDATGRVQAQSGVGEEFRMGGGHETKYYYGTTSQEELDGLFGTEVGEFSHYFKNMVRDANGQMSVSYVDMHGRTIATALAGNSPASLKPLDIGNPNIYDLQKDANITSNLLSSGTNTVKDNALESVNTILVPASGIYNFSYHLDPAALQLPKCSSPDLCYKYIYNLEIAINNEAGENSIQLIQNGTASTTSTPNLTKKFNNKSNFNANGCSAAFTDETGSPVADNIVNISVQLQPGSYTIRKTLTLDEESLQTYLQQYLQPNVGICSTKEQIIDSIYTILKSTTGCEVTNSSTVSDCQRCQDQLGTFQQYKAGYLAASNGQALSDGQLLAFYTEEAQRCRNLCMNVSHRLDAIRQGMLADMMPYTGQYATNPLPANSKLVTITGKVYDRSNMYSSWDIFANNLYKTSIPTFTGTTPDDFEQQFQPSWAEALLTHHPEYGRLTTALDLQNSYNVYDWIDGFMSVDTWDAASSKNYLTQLSTLDPLIASVPDFSSGDKTKMGNYVNGTGTGWYKGLSMWQIAWGKVRCKNAVSGEPMENCFSNAGKVPDGTYSSLPMEERDAIWNAFKSMYASVRDEMLTNYLSAKTPISDASSLVSQGYALHFVNNSSMLGQQYAWTWYPTSPISPSSLLSGPSLPGISMQDTLKQLYSGGCSSYVQGWRNTLMQCQGINNLPNRDVVLDDIIARMEALCKMGTDAANPYGVSTLPPFKNMSNGDVSFEQIINSVLQAKGISKDLLCNAFVIEFPKPYAVGYGLPSQMISSLDTCTCKQYNDIKQAVINTGFDPYNYYSFNDYLRSTHKDTVTVALFNALQHCSELGQRRCEGGSGGTFNYSPEAQSPEITMAAQIVQEPSVTASVFSIPAMQDFGISNVLNTVSSKTPTSEIGSSGNGDDYHLIQATYGSSLEDVQPDTVGAPIQMLYLVQDPLAKCDTPYYYHLPVAQPLPYFLTCGYVDQQACLSCKQLSDLLTSFKQTFPTAAVAFHEGNVREDSAAWNSLFQRFVNFRTGYNYTWLDYYSHAKASGCELANYATNTSTVSVICRDSVSIKDTILVQRDKPCQKAYNIAVNMAEEIYEKRRSAILANAETAYRAGAMTATGEAFSMSYGNSLYHFTLYYYDMAGNLVKTVPPKGVKADFRQTFLDQVKQARINNTDKLVLHKLVTNYRYNSLNQVVAQNTPDAGTSLFWYDRLGRLVISQNAKQYPGSQYSYTLYDVLGRINEVGQIASTDKMTQAKSSGMVDLDAWLTTAKSTKEQITRTYYDFPYYNAEAVISLEPLITQRNLRNRVAWTAVYDNNTDLEQTDHIGHASATFYTYDIHGNVDTLLQDYRKGIMAENNNGNRFKKIAYQYDLISGKVNEVVYQPDIVDASLPTGIRIFADKFYHQYKYDAENRITEVCTSRDSIYWERDASYQYYRHGPMARLVLGQQQVQGLDYVYTLQGRIKAINPSSPAGTGVCAEGFAANDLILTERNAGDPAIYTGRNSISFEEGFINGTTDDYFSAVVDASYAPCNSNAGNYNTTDGKTESKVAEDAYNVVLNYYDKDYSGINAPSPSIGMATKLGIYNDYKPLYNGNISSMAVNLTKLNSPMVYAYQYDQLNRLVNMNAYNSSDENWGSLSSSTNYQESLVYDPNGNIIKYKRNGNLSSNPLMDDFSYAYDYYTAGGIKKSYVPNQAVPSDAAMLTNRLNSVKDDVLDGIYTGDLDNQNADNYKYDAVGNLIKDTKGEIGSIEWNVYGKIIKIIKNDAINTVIAYSYDAAGDRLSTTISKNGIDNIIWYVKDASGNVVSVYSAIKTDANAITELKQAELHLYGNQRLGILNTSLDVLANLNVNLTDNDGLTNTFKGTFERGDKNFELSNHLGSVLSIVTDGKLQNTADNQIVSTYSPKIVSVSDQAPFGMNLIGRNWNSDRYRFGFNGKEKNDEVNDKSVTYDYGFRIYDARIAKFLSVDPLQTKYPFYTPYQFAGNRPIQAKDLDGREPDLINFIIDYFYVRPAVKVSNESKVYVKNLNTVMSHDNMGHFDQSGKSGSIQDQVDQKNLNTGLAEAQLANSTASATDGALEFASTPFKVVFPEAGLIEAPINYGNGDNLKGTLNLAGGLLGNLRYLEGLQAIKQGGNKFSLKSLGILKKASKNSNSGTLSSYDNYGLEFSDDGLSMTGSGTPSVAAEAGIQLKNSVTDVLGSGYSSVAEVTVPIKNTDLLTQLNASSKGDWVKVYEAGYQNGNKIETHYFRNNNTSQVFDVKIKYNSWHQKAFKNK